jgi:hypothetical protein
MEDNMESNIEDNMEDNNSESLQSELKERKAIIKTNDEEDKMWDKSIEGVRKATTLFNILSIIFGILAIVGATAFIIVKQNELARYDALQSEYNTLNSSRIILQSEYEDLLLEYNKLNEEHSKLQTKHDTLNAKHLTLQSDHDNLNYRYTALDSNYKDLNSEYGILLNKYPIIITQMRMGDYGSNNWIIRPGEKLYASQLHNLAIQLTYKSFTSITVNLYVKIINPDGTLHNYNTSSPLVYTIAFSSNNSREQSLTIPKSTYTGGTYRVEIWLDSVCVESTTFILN